MGVDISGPTRDATAAPSHVRALLSPAAYDHPADDLRLHETHISWVVLVGPYAYKVKKSVDFGFLDFSTVERRAAACVDEVRLNRRLAPDIYLGVVWIVERAGGYHVGGTGTPVEPVVKMRRLPEDGMLPNLLASGEADAGLVRRIARRIATFHARAATGPGVDEHGSAAAIRTNWEENFAQMAPLRGRVLDSSVDDHTRRYVDGFLAEHADLFVQRVAAGRIREGHGDLHAASICVIHSRLVFFDCLEFNARFRCADIAAEAGFLAMDLDHHGRADLAHAFIQAYIRASGDVELPALLPFYQCYRAYVRGKVRCLRLTEPGLTPEAAARTVTEARAYFDLAWAYAGGLPGPLLLIVMGLPASGKTTLARALARRLGLLQLSSDVIRKELAGLRPTDHARDAFRRGLYDPTMTRRTYAAMRRRAAVWLGRGRSVILDATFGRQAEREAALRLARRLGVRPVLFICRTDEATTLLRLRARDHDETSVSDARIEQWPALRDAFEEPVELSDALVVDTSTSMEDAVEWAMAALRR
jgi:aminoglycoside phosphotransferase family enzyme/predicted kinase